MSLSGAPVRRKKASDADRDQGGPGRPALLLAWSARHRRRLRWRPLQGEKADPYRVWLSEIMLQQTGVKTVGPYFEKFLARWPGIDALGRASLDDVLRMWAGLGYYSRARNLHACAVAVLRDHGGAFPDTEQGLRSLPGVGPYTAAAIAAIAFGRRTMPVDGNIERVVSRLCHWRGGPAGPTQISTACCRGCSPRGSRCRRPSRGSASARRRCSTPA